MESSLNSQSDVGRQELDSSSCSQHQAGERNEGNDHEGETESPQGDCGEQQEETQRVEGKEEDSMKRRVNNIHLSCVTSLIPGFVKLVIEDRLASKIYMDNSPDTKRWEGLAKDFYKAPDEIRYKWGMTRLYKIEPQGDHILLVICTQYEPY